MEQKNTIAGEAKQKTQENPKPKGWLNKIKQRHRIVASYKLTNNQRVIKYYVDFGNNAISKTETITVERISSPFYSLAKHLGLIDILIEQKNLENVAIKKLVEAGIKKNTIAHREVMRAFNKKVEIIRPYRRGYRNGRKFLVDNTDCIKRGLILLNIPFNWGNDAPMGSRNGDFIKIIQ